MPSSDGLASIRRDFLATGDAATALAERNAQVDRLVLEAAAELLLPTAPAGLAVLAVGGYGRRQLFPYSDVDLLLLFESEKLAVDSKDAIAAFLRHFVDSDLRVSHSVRTPAECTEVHDRNIELNISLLDQRYLTGDRALYAGVAEKLPRFIQGNRGPLVRNLAQLARARHAKYAGTFYHLEPNVKETPAASATINWSAGSINCMAGGIRRRRRWRPLSAFWGGCAAICITSPGATTTRFPSTPGRHRGAMAEWRCRSMDARVLSPRAVVYRAAIRALDASEAQFSSLFAQFRDWRSASGERRLHGASGAHPLPRSATPGGGAGAGAEPVRIRGAPRHTSFRGGRAADRTAAAQPARALCRTAAPVARAEYHPRASVRAAGRPGDARNRRAGRHFSGDGADRMPGDPRLFSPLHGGRAHPRHHAEPQETAGGHIASCWRK